MESSIRSKSVLSTKLLSESQKKTLVHAGVNLFDYDAIKIEFLDFDVPKKVKNAIFTSKNAVQALKYSNNRILLGAIENCYCVGKSTMIFLEENDQKVIKSTEYASELAELIINEDKNEAFYFFCGTHRRDEIPTTLKNAEIDFFEVKTYKTELNLTKYEQIWDYILFFSPSGVQSFTAENKIDESAVVCIGETTASEAKKNTKNVFVAAETTVDSVIAKAVSLINERNI